MQVKAGSANRFFFVYWVRTSTRLEARRGICPRLRDECYGSFSMVPMENQVKVSKFVWRAKRFETNTQLCTTHSQFSALRQKGNRLELLGQYAPIHLDWHLSIQWKFVGPMKASLID